MLDEQPERQERPRGLRLTPGNIITILVVALGGAVQFGINESQITNMQTRLDKHESQESIFIRSDVQNARDEVIMSQLRSAIERLDRIQKLLDENSQNGRR